MSKFSQEIEVSGHLIDSLILTKIFDKIMDLKGEFEVQKIKIGKRKKESIRWPLTSISWENLVILLFSTSW